MTIARIRRQFFGSVFQHFFDTAMSDHSELKYRIQELMDQIPRSISPGTITGLLEKEYGILSRSFYRHRSIPKNSESVISEAELAAYARFFGVHESELRNYQPVKDKQPLTALLKITPRQTRLDLERMTGMVASK